MPATLSAHPLWGTGEPKVIELNRSHGSAIASVTSALKGKPVLLNFWPTWGAPCRQSVPSLERLYADYKDRGLVVLAVNAGEERDAVREFLKKTPLAYPAVLGSDAGILKDYHVTAYPTFVLIGRDGKVAAYEIGLGGESVLRTLLEKAAKAR